MSGYIAELRENWRPLLGATIGIGTGMSVSGLVTSTIAPHLVRGNGWAQADFALVGTIGLIVAASLPVVGRLADVLGVRTTALIGQVTIPLFYVALSVMDGKLSTFIALFLLQSVIGVTTTATVYSRIPVQFARRSRGLALALVASGPAIVGALGGPLLNDYVESYGWRSSYRALAFVAAVAGFVAFLLLPGSDRSAGSARAPRRARSDYGRIIRAPAFWIMLLSMLLCNLPQVITMTQLKLLLLANGVEGAAVGGMLSALSIGMLTGRIITGIALDRFNPYLVSVAMLGLPSVGLFLIASPMDAVMMIMAAVFCIGFAFGAEGDIVAFLVARQFGVQIYSSVLGLMTGVMSFSAALGAALLSLTLAWTGGFTLFLLLVGTGVAIGALLLALLARFDSGDTADGADAASVPEPVLRRQPIRIEP